MPHTKSYTVYHIDELSPEAKKKAIEAYRDQITPYFQMEHDTTWVDQTMTDLMSMGFQEKFKTVEYDEKVKGRFTGNKKTRQERVWPDLRYSLGHNQGDGVAFYGRIDVWKFLDYFATTEDQDDYISEERANEAQGLIDRLKQHFDPETFSLVANVTPNSYGHHYSHSNTMAFDWEYGPEDEQHAKLAEEVLDFVSEVCRHVSKVKEKGGYEEIDYHFADEQIEERAQEAEIEFHEDGRLFKA